MVQGDEDCGRTNIYVVHGEFSKTSLLFLKGEAGPMVPKRKYISISLDDAIINNGSMKRVGIYFLILCMAYNCMYHA